MAFLNHTYSSSKKVNTMASYLLNFALNMKGKDAESLGDAITRLLDVYGIKNKLKAVELEDSWAQIVGPMIAKYTREVKLRNSTLIVKFDSAPLKQEVIMMKSKFIARINQDLGGEYVKELLVL